MIALFCKTRPTRTCLSNLGFIITIVPSRLFSLPITQESHFTVWYLINSCNLSPQSAKSVSKKIHFETSKKPDSMISFLKEHGFTDKHFSRMVTSYPRILLMNPNKTLLPKFQFLYSLGLSTPDIVNVFCRRPSFFYRSLTNYIIPCYNKFKSIFLDDKAAVSILKAWSRNSISTITSNVAVLKDIGIPETIYPYLCRCYCSVITQDPLKMKKRVGQVIQMGFNTNKVTFLQALNIVTSLSESTLNHKMELYMMWGWSEEDVQTAFRRCPMCLSLSEKKLIGMMDFLVNKMGWPSKAIARIPIVLCMSLENRVVPRCSVVKVLQLKGLTKKNFISSALFTMIADDFIDRFVTKYEEHVPQLMELYKGKVGFVELGLKKL